MLKRKKKKLERVKENSYKETGEYSELAEQLKEKLIKKEHGGEEKEA